MNDTSKEYTFTAPPKPVGYWVLYEGAPQLMMFEMHHKPTEQKIKNTEELLGWKWRDA